MFREKNRLRQWDTASKTGIESESARWRERLLRVEGPDQEFEPVACYEEAEKRDDGARVLKLLMPHA